MKNGSKARALVSAFMPVPVSVTASSTYGPATTANGSPSIERVSSTLAVSIVSARRGHRVARVDGEVHQHLLELAASALTGHRSSDEIRAQLDVLADQAREQLLDVMDDRVDVEHRGCSTCWRLNASSCRVSAAARSPAFLISSALRRSGSSSRELPQQDLGVAADRLDEVVEVVGDAAGEPADRLHLLHALEADLALEQALFGDLAQDRRGEDVAERLQERQVLRARQSVVDVEHGDHAERMADAVEAHARHRLHGVIAQHGRQSELGLRR